MPGCPQGVLGSAGARQRGSVGSLGVTSLPLRELFFKDYVQISGMFLNIRFCRIREAGSSRKLGCCQKPWFPHPFDRGIP